MCDIAVKTLRVYNNNDMILHIKLNLRFSVEIPECNGTHPCLLSQLKHTKHITLKFIIKYVHILTNLVSNPVFLPFPK